MTRALASSPRVHLHRGRVVAAALWFDPSLLGEREARGRVLAEWSPGTTVSAVAGGFLLRLSQPRALFCAEAPGLPLTLEDGVLFSAPLTSAERARLAAPPGALVLVRAGSARVYPPKEARRVDVSAWLDVSAWHAVDAVGLGAAPPPAAVLESVPAPSRERFGPGVPALAPEAEAMLARMRAQPAPVVSSERPRSRSWASRLIGWMRGEPSPGTSSMRPRSRSLMGQFIGWLRGRSGEPLAASTSTALAPSPGRPSLLSRLTAWWRTRRGAGSAEAAPRPSGETASAPLTPGSGALSRLAAWALDLTPLGAWLRARKAEYVRHLFELFEEGDLREALRYAIPLGGQVSAQATQALGLPGPREGLSINLQRGGAASVFGSSADVYAALKQRYRAAFQRLEREGRIDEAAFVLDELLGAHEEAVSFLERHGRLRLAAELAEARGLPPGLVVRQWFLARDVARAVALARRHGAFANAVSRLERQGHPEQARALRLVWAEMLAEAGDFALAVDVVWSVPDARPLARAWLERAVARGGIGAATCLVRLLSTFPELFESLKGRVMTLLTDEDPERAVERAAFAEALVALPTGALRTALAGPTARALLRDRAVRPGRLSPRGWTSLLSEAGHGTLRADLPAGLELGRVTSQEWGPVRTERLSLDEAGACPVHDAVLLPEGRVLVALGEAGARLLRADGKTLAHFDVPAFSLVSSIHGDRVLALAPRGELQRISRLDLVERRARPWRDARVDAFAPTYNGALWFVAEGPSVLGVDTLSDDWRAVWHVSRNGPSRVRSMALDASWFSYFAVDEAEGAKGEVCIHELKDGAPVLRTVREVSDADGFRTSYLLPGGLLALPAPVLAASSKWLVQPRGDATGSQRDIALSDLSVTRLEFVFEGPHPVRARFSQNEVLLFDDAGRLVRVDLAGGAVRRLRVL
ncbi:bpX6 domain-containing protein [Myxococcaceae bacterium GXIMD 01537]